MDGGRVEEQDKKDRNPFELRIKSKKNMLAF